MVELHHVKLHLHPATHRLQWRLPLEVVLRVEVAVPDHLVGQHGKPRAVRVVGVASDSTVLGHYHLHLVGSERPYLPCRRVGGAALVNPPERLPPEAQIRLYGTPHAAPRPVLIYTIKEPLHRISLADPLLVPVPVEPVDLEPGSGHGIGTELYRPVDRDRGAVVALHTTQLSLAEVVHPLGDLLRGKPCTAARLGHGRARRARWRAERPLWAFCVPLRADYGEPSPLALVSSWFLLQVEAAYSSGPLHQLG